MHTTHYTLINTYANTHGSWSIGSSLVAPPKEVYHDFYWPWMYDLDGNGNLVGEFGEVILTGHWDSRKSFGHCMHDMITPISLLPNHIIQNSYVIGSGRLEFPNELLRIIGFPDSKIIKLNDKDWILAHKLHVFSDWRPLSNLAGDATIILREKLLDSLNLSNFVPFRYTVTNRVKRRGILNIDEVLNAIKLRFSDREWFLNNCTFGNVSTYAYIWTESKFMLTPVGSNAFNSIFMRENTIFCMGMANWFDPYSVYFIASSKIFLYIFSVPGMQHNPVQMWNWSISFTLTAIEEALYHEKYGHFHC